jgi:protein SCO1/2
MKHIYLMVIAILMSSTFIVAVNKSNVQVGIEERLGETIPLDLNFIDENGDSLRLFDYIDKPTIITLVYYNCPGICTPLLGEMTDLVDNMDLKPGIDYKILTISFNHRDTPEIAKNKKQNFLKGLRKRFPDDQWRWTTGDSVTIHKFTHAVGFNFMPDSSNFAHPTSLIVLSRDGKISRYLYGIRQLPFDLEMAVVEASQGRVGPTISKVLQMCFSYDREGEKYAFDFTRVGGGFILLFLVIFVVGISINTKKKRKRTR